MSWEHFEEKKSCPCGNGTFTETRSDNDWGQFTTNWAMDCADCSSRYSLYAYTYYRSAMPCEGYRWIDKYKLEHAISLQDKVKSIKEKVIDLAYKKYIDILLNHFNKSNKKEIWAVINSKIYSFKSLNSFYQSTSGWSKIEYLGTLFCDDYLDAMFNIINVSDNEIEDLRKKALKLNQEAEEILSGR